MACIIVFPCVHFLVFSCAPIHLLIHLLACLSSLPSTPLITGLLACGSVI